MTVGHLNFLDNLDGNGFLNPVAARNLTRISMHRDGTKRIQRPLSLLHLGYDFDVFAVAPGLNQGGYRGWMDIGTMCMSGTDHLYVGLRQQSKTTTGFPGTMLDYPDDRQDAVICWGDNSSPPVDYNGPDNLCFVFTSPPKFGVQYSSTSDGREVMRMIHNGFVGHGPVFSNDNQPKSEFHMHKDKANSNWFQMTNEALPGVTASTLPGLGGTVNANDGLRMGIFGSGSLIQNGIGMLYNQEDRALLFSTNGNTTIANATNTRERFRIMSVSTPTFIPFPLVPSIFGAYGTYNPGAFANTNITRSSISHDPNAPVNRPLSLLHLGYNASVNAAGTLFDGWRPWMDIGTFTSSQFDHTYFGLKAEGTKTYDAVVGWGRNVDSLPNSGPDHLRFIFTGNYSPLASIDTANEAYNLNGMECGRFVPIRDTLGQFGRFGVGDFTSTGVNQEPTHKLDVVGNGRFRFLPDSIYIADNSVNKTVMVDSLGVLRWGPTQAGGIGNYCTATTTNPLSGNYEIKFNDKNIYYPGQGLQAPSATTNAIGVGYGCGASLLAKFNVKQQDSAQVNHGTTAGYFQDSDQMAIGFFGVFRGVLGNASRNQPGNGSNNGGEFIGGNAALSIGVKGRAFGNSLFTGKFYGGWFESITSDIGDNIGLAAFAKNGSANNIAIYAETDTNVVGNLAADFVGDVVVNGTLTVTSDINFKENINPISNADSILILLNPVYFNYKQTGDAERLNLPATRQPGVIAQQIETVLPNIVKTITHPAKVDSTGTIVAPSFTYKTVDYEKLIPILIGGYKIQKSEIDNLKEENSNKDSIIAALNAKNDEQDSLLNLMWNCLQATNLCNEARSIQPTGANVNNQTNVELTNAQSVILDQNVPNPFAEQTTVTYNLLEGTKRAQMLFYNSNGQMINSVELSTTSGKGQLNVFANDLTNGVYTYTLVVDGKIIDTKRMVKNK